MIISFLESGMLIILALFCLGAKSKRLRDNEFEALGKFSFDLDDSNQTILQSKS
jgi:hypothetical protein